MLPYPQHHLLGQGRNTLARKALAISRPRRRLGNQHLYFDFDVQHHLRLYRQQQYQDIVLPPCCCRSSAPCNSLARHRAYAQRLRDCQHQQHRPGIETTNRSIERLDPPPAAPTSGATNSLFLCICPIFINFAYSNS